ncbi:hypothetical protein C8034_v009520 [Colletotrichum sidae]|uniref:Secreted protein n=1 Tax=Colletotrichum sidae TaxID=1347389 RepID=A0A4R8TJQ4_9PEZI|nr:hypothetical protein C8034_v009520 [Colletotrichum sidae]
MVASRAISIVFLLLAGYSHAVDVCCTSAPQEGSCSKDQYERHQKNVVLNQIINRHGKGCVRKGAGPGRWGEHANWSEYYVCDEWENYIHRITTGDCLLICGAPYSFDYKPCI